jgi:hypothetical protein
MAILLWNRQRIPYYKDNCSRAVSRKVQLGTIRPGVERTGLLPSFSSGEPSCILKRCGLLDFLTPRQGDRAESWPGPSASASRWRNH